MMLGRGALPPPHPPYWPAFGRRERIGSGGALHPRTPPTGRPLAGEESSSALPFGRLISMMGGGALPPLHPSYWPAFGRREISGASPFGRL